MSGKNTYPLRGLWWSNEELCPSLSTWSWIASADYDFITGGRERHPLRCRRSRFSSTEQRRLYWFLAIGPPLDLPLLHLGDLNLLLRLLSIRYRRGREMTKIGGKRARSRFGRRRQNKGRGRPANCDDRPKLITPFLFGTSRKECTCPWSRVETRRAPAGEQTIKNRPRGRLLGFVPVFRQSTRLWPTASNQPIDDVGEKKKRRNEALTGENLLIADGGQAVEKETEVEIFRRLFYSLRGLLSSRVKFAMTRFQSKARCNNDSARSHLCGTYRAIASGRSWRLHPPMSGTPPFRAEELSKLTKYFRNSSMNQCFKIFERWSQSVLHFKNMLTWNSRKLDNVQKSTFVMLRKKYYFYFKIITMSRLSKQ